MSTKKPPVAAGEVDEARYSAFADSIERGEYEPVPTTLRRGRPDAASAGRGTSPLRAVRLPAALDEQLNSYTNATGESVSAVVRAALADYLARHPLGA